MCGIHFILDKKSKLDYGPIRNMVESTHYRGPDDSDIKQFQIGKSQYFIGANRLKITDPSPKSIQPFGKKGNPNFLAFNGEIYNYQILKNLQLQQGLQFESASDTEVLFNHLYASWETHLSQLNGMFAFLFLNTDTGDFLYARDTWGMKPLFCFENEHFFILSSEIKGILSTGLVEKKLNDLAVHDYLQYRYCRRPSTFFQNIFEVEPGSWKKIEETGKTSFGNFSVDENQNGKEIHESRQVKKPSFNDTVQKVDELLSDALLSHLPSTGLPGLFLSGGVDSTLLLAKLSELGIRNIPTFSFVSSDEDKPYGTQDWKYAQKASRQYQSIHSEITTDRGVMGDLDDFIADLDQPIGDSGEFMIWLLSKEAVKKSRVFFSGAGADELFAGYNRHRAFSFYLKNYSWGQRLKGPGIFASKILGIFDKNRGRLSQLFFQSINEDAGITWNQMIIFPQFFKNQQEKHNWGVGSKMDRKGLMNKALNNDRRQYLISDVLAISDRASMRASMELRMPYLDRDLANFTCKLSPQVLLTNGSKSILKELLIRKGGKAYCNRSKEGFGLPFGGWLVKDLTGIQKEIEKEFEILNRFVTKHKIKNLFEEHKSQRNNTLVIWSLLILSKWLQANFS